LPIIESKADIVTIFVKCSISQVTNVLKIDLEENLKLIKESIKYLKNQNKYVIIDLEHFFD
jgi:2-isopropylmalate synthase